MMIFKNLSDVFIEFLILGDKILILPGSKKWEKEMDENQFKEFVRYVVSRLDGAWFRMVEKKYGVTVATDLDAEVWEDLYMRLARYLKKVPGLKDYDPQTYIKTYIQVKDALGVLLAGEDEHEFIGNKIISRVINCRQWEEIQKAGFTDYAKAGKMCSKAHISAHRGLMKGLFPNRTFKLTQTKRIPAGDDWCELEIEIE